jgi:hypothetical protein
MINEITKHPEWENVKTVMEESVDEEFKLIAYNGIDDSIVGQEYKAMRKAKNMIKRIISKIENANAFGNKPRVIR